MNNHEIPVKEPEKNSIEERDVPVDTQEEGHNQPKPVASSPAERPQRPVPLLPYTPLAQLPAWSGYAPGAPPPWAGQPGPYYPRRPARWPWIVLTFFLLFLLIAGGAFFLFAASGYNFAGYTNSVAETQHFNVTANPTLILNNDTGSIHVRAASSGSQITIQAIRHSGARANPNDIKVSYTQNVEMNTVTVSVVRMNRSTFFSSLSVDFDVAVPATSALQVKTNTGGIDVSGVSGQMVLTSNTGSIEARDATLSGSSELITNTGSVTLVGTIGPGGTYSFQTNTGSVNVTLPGASVFHVDASTDTGSINTNFPGVIAIHRQFVGADAHSDVGSSPQATIRLSTNTGSINLYQR
jgi:hypothetical protein